MTYSLRGRSVRLLVCGILLCSRTLQVSSAETLESIKAASALVPHAQSRFDGTPSARNGAVAFTPFTMLTVGEARVFFLNIGQGDSSYIELPNGRNVLIDGGPSSANISAFLKNRGVTQLDHVVMTHPHTDHYKGLNYVFDELQVRTFYDTRINNTGAKGDEIVREKAAREPGCRTYYPEIGQMLDWGEGVTAKVFNSCAEASTSDSGVEGGRELNNCSIVIKFVSKGRSVLFTGDAQSKTERVMIKQFGGELAADILKVGHHGSAESSTLEFLNVVHPRIAIISVGKNGYGLPTQDTLDRLMEAGAAVYRTDSSGTIGPLRVPLASSR